MAASLETSPRATPPTPTPQNLGQPRPHLTSLSHPVFSVLPRRQLVRGQQRETLCPVTTGSQVPGVSLPEAPSSAPPGPGLSTPSGAGLRLADRPTDRCRCGRISAGMPFSPHVMTRLLTRESMVPGCCHCARPPRHSERPVSAPAAPGREVATGGTVTGPQGKWTTVPPLAHLMQTDFRHRRVGVVGEPVILHSFSAAEK